jgi:hypothetical protein
MRNGRRRPLAHGVALAFVAWTSACERAPEHAAGSKPIGTSASDSSSPTRTTIAAPTTSASSTNALPAPSASTSVSPAASAWPAGTGAITLAWVLHPVVLRGATTARHVDVVARAGSITRSVSTDVQATTMFVMEMQPRCTHAPRARAIAELFMNGGGNFRLSAERPKPEWLEVYANESADGLCVDDAGHDADCPVARTLLARWEVPRDARIVEAFEEIARDDTDAGPATGAARRRTLECP